MEAMEFILVVVVVLTVISCIYLYNNNNILESNVIIHINTCYSISCTQMSVISDMGLVKVMISTYW